MVTEQVRMWRAAEGDNVLLMAGWTSTYAVQPRGEYVFGVVAGQPMLSRRGREHRLVRPGQLVAWDPSHAHAGAAIDGHPWWACLIVVENGDLAALAGDQDHVLTGDIAFPEPVMSDPALVDAFLRLHNMFEAPTTRLERDEYLTEWLHLLVDRAAATRRMPGPLTSRDGRALRQARDYLGDHPERNVGLDELAAAAGIGKFRLVRLFRERTGLPPHALQVAFRVRQARQLLESGRSPADVAAATGFVDQSHLHRHFRRTLGLTPAEYQRRFTRTVRAGTR